MIANNLQVIPASYQQADGPGPGINNRESIKTDVMDVKIDTKEKFHVITILDKEIPANMTEEMKALFHRYLQNDVKNVVVNMKEVEHLSEPAGHALVQAQQTAYENSASFVICQLAPAVEKWLDQVELLELMNVTPTESEAWDIVQMEEIERELFD
jgi:anti-anti-sigma factor